MDQHDALDNRISRDWQPSRYPWRYSERQASGAAPRHYQRHHDGHGPKPWQKGEWRPRLPSEYWKGKCLRVPRHQEMGSQISVHSLLATLREQYSHGDRHRNKQPEITEEGLFDILRKDTYRFRAITYVEALPSRKWKPSQPPSGVVATAPQRIGRDQGRHAEPSTYTAAQAAQAAPKPVPHPSNWRSWAPVPTSKPMSTLSFSSTSTSRSEESDYSEPDSGDRPHIREGNRKRSRSRRGSTPWNQVYEKYRH